MSLLLVLAMVLAMVPAVLAASETDSLTESRDAAPGQTLELRLPEEKFKGTTYYWKAGYSYNNVLSVQEYSTKDSSATSDKNEALTNSVTVAAGVSQKQEMYVYVYATASAADKNNGFGYSYGYGDQSLRAIYAFKITVTPWKISLAVDSVSNGFNNKLSAGGTVTLRATVTGPSSLITSQKVKFKINGTTGIAELGQETVPLDLDSETSAIARVVVTAGKAEGGFSVTASVTPTTSSGGEGSAITARYPASGSISVGGSTQYTLTVEENIYVTKGGTRKYIQPKLTTSTGSSVTASYTYSVDAKSNQTDTSTGPTGSLSRLKIVVNDSGEIVPQVEETNEPVKVTVATTTVSGVTPVVCYVNIVKNAATITGLTVNTDLTNKRFAKIDGTFDASSAYGKLINGMMTNKLELKATVESESDNAASRLVWKSSNEKIATVTPKSGSDTVTVTAVATGEVTITATMPSASGNGTSKSVKLYVWDAKAYKKIEGATLGGTINDPYATAEELGKQQLKATLDKGTNKTATLYASYVPTAANADGTSYNFIGTVNPFDESAKIVYYPTSSCEGLTKEYKISLGPATVSTVQITGPQDASFKVNETLGSLTCTIRTTGIGEFITKVVWKDKNNNEIQVDSNTGTDAKIKQNQRYYVSTLNLASKITSPGEYQYYCEVTTSKSTDPIRSGIANVTVGGDYIISIEGLPTSVKVGDTITFTAKPKQYANGKYTDVTGSNYTVAWTVSDASVGTLNRTTGSSVSFSVKGGGKVTVSAETTIGNNKYAGTKEFTVTVPTADTVRLTLGENDSYVLLDGSKLAAAVKDVCKTTPSTFVFKSPANGTLYTTSSLSNTASTSTKYSSSEVSKMAYRPTRTTGTHEIEYTAYDGSAQIATGKVLVMTSANTVEYHIAANEKQQMVVSDFQSVYGTGLSSVTFSSNTDSRGGLYKGSTTSSGKVGSESYSVSSGTNLLKNVYFIANSTVSKYSVTIPFTATGSAGTVSGQLVVYVNDTHTLSSTGATFRSMGIAAELAPDNATGSTYITIDRVVGGKLYSSYTSIKRCTALTSKDLGSTKFYFTGSNSLDNLYVLPMADSKSVDVTYTIDGITKGTLSFKVNQQKASNQFTDVVANFSWAANSVDFMYTNDIIKGNSSTNPRIFGPRAMMTRAMLVTVLYRAAGEPTVAGITNKFTDNKQGQYYYNAVLWASNMGIVNGSTATTFEPNGNITREQIAAILYRYAGSPTVTGSLSGYPDQAQVSSFAVSAMQWAVSSGIITGVNDGSKTTLSAKGNATRAQVAVMLHRFLTFD